MAHSAIEALLWIAAIILCCRSGCLQASKLNLTESCSGDQTFYCSLTNISSTLDDPLEVVDANQPLRLLQVILRNSRLGRIPIDIFLQAPKLRVLVMHNCNLQKLNSSDFAQAPQLQELTLQKNRFFELPEKVFATAVGLVRLQLPRNTIHMIHRTAFAGLSNLRYLDLQQNAIHTLHEDVFADLVNLEHIDLSSNNIEKIDSNVFAMNSKLEAVILGDNSFALFEPNSLRHLPHLHLLDVSNSPIEELSLQSVDTLLAQNSALKRCVISGSVLKVHAGNNHLSTISIGDSLAVRELELHGNAIESLDIFTGMWNLQRLDVSKNRIKSIRTTHPLQSLPLPSLTYLNLASNQLQNLSVESFLVLEKLTHLDLAFNHLEHLDQHIFEPLLNLEKLYIEANRLHSFDYESLLRSHERLKELGLFDNEWEFSYMRKMVTYLKDRDVYLPVRFTPISGLELRTSTATERPGTTKKMPHHFYEAIVEKDLSTAEPLLLHDPSGVTGIHPYWTTRDVLAMVTLLFVLLILILQLLRILKEEQCLTWCWRRSVEHIGGNRDQNQHRRMDEDDSEV